MLVPALMQELLRRGYTVERTGTEERVIRPDGSVAIIARRPGYEEFDAETVVFEEITQARLRRQCRS